MFKLINQIFDKQKALKAYETMFEGFLDDNKLDKKEIKQLEAFVKENKLENKDLAGVHKKVCSKYFTKINNDDRVTDEENKTLNELLDYLELTNKDFNFDQEKYNKSRVLALIDKGELPEIKVPELNIIFKSGEVLHFASNSSLRKLKKVTQRINYGGLTGSIKIAKGIRYRVGSLGISTQTSEYIATEDSGAIWFTNQRMGFKGLRKNFAFPYSKILSFELTKDGLYITKDGKETPYIIGLKDYDVVCSLISFILNK